MINYCAWALDTTLWLQKQGKVEQEPAADDDDGASIWDWTPPGDLAETAAWKVLRELAMTLSRSEIPPWFLMGQLLTNHKQS